jgi:replicative DNA helicase
MAKTLADRLPPQNLDAERGVIGGVMLDNDMADECIEILSPSDFYRDSHQEIWSSIIQLRDSDHGIDMVSLADIMTRAGRYQAIGGDDTIAEILNSVPHAANTRYHAEIVRQKAITRNIIQFSTEIIKDAYSNLFTANELLGDAETKILSIGDRDSGVKTMASQDVICNVMQMVELRKTGDFDGLRTGFSDLDGMVLGLQPGDMVVVAGRPGAGKTSLAMQIASNVAIFQRASVLVCSLEMNKESLFERLISTISRVDANRLRKPRYMSKQDEMLVLNAAHVISSASIHINDRGGTTMSQIAASARRCKSRHGLDLIVIDYLSLVNGQKKKGESRQEEVAGVSRRIKAMAKSLGCPVIAIQQLNRQSEGRKDFRPMLSDLRESGAIEADADLVLLVHRPEMYDPNDSPGIAEIIVAKQRNGSTGTVKLAFNRSMTRFDDLSVLSEGNEITAEPF